MRIEKCRMLGGCMEEMDGIRKEQKIGKGMDAGWLRSDLRREGDGVRRRKQKGRGALRLTLKLLVLGWILWRKKEKELPNLHTVLTLSQIMRRFSQEVEAIGQLIHADTWVRGSALPEHMLR